MAREMIVGRNYEEISAECGVWSAEKKSLNYGSIAPLVRKADEYLAGQQMSMLSYNKLVVYQKAEEAHRRIYRFLRGNPALPSYIKSQLGRASLSVQLNIAEASGKFSEKDKRHYYVVSRASVFETVALINFLAEDHDLPQTLNAELLDIYHEVSAMLYTLIRKYKT